MCNKPLTKEELDRMFEAKEAARPCAHLRLTIMGQCLDCWKLPYEQKWEREEHSKKV